MKTRIYIFLGIALATLFYSCEKTIDFKGDYMESKLVVNGNLMAGNKIWAGIYKSRSFLSEEEFYHSLPNAEVKLYENGVYVETLEYKGSLDTLRKQLPYDVVKEYVYNRGSYFGRTIAQAGKSYRLEVTCNGFETVTCETTIPAPVEITKIDTFTEIIVKDYGVLKYNWINIHFHDPVETQNYYMLQSDRTTGFVLNHNYSNVEEPFVPSDTILVRNDSYTGIQFFDPVFNNNNQAEDVIMGSPNNQYGIFNDSKIDGKDYKLSLVNYNLYESGGYNPYQSDGNENNSNDGFEYGNFNLLNIKLVSITKEYYNYLNTANYHFWFSDDPFSEPVSVASNVNGGMGIWAASGASEVKVVQGIYPMPGKTYINEYDYYNQNKR